MPRRAADAAPPLPGGCSTLMAPVTAAGREVYRLVSSGPW